MRKLFLALLILGLVVNPVFSADKWMEGDGSDVISGTDSVSDVDTLLASSSTNPLDRLLDKYLTGCSLTWTDADTITVGIGSVACEDAGGVHRFRENTSTFTIDLSVSSDTAGVDKVGDVDKASSWFYVYANADADATTFTGCASLSDAAPDGPTYFRLIGAVYNDAGQDMLAFYQRGDIVMYDIPRNMSTTLSNNAWTDGSTLAKGDCATLIPSISEMGIFGLLAVEGGTECGVWIRPNDSTWATDNSNAVFAGNDDVGGQRFCATDTSQVINYQTQTDDTAVRIDVEGYIINLY